MKVGSLFSGVGGFDMGLEAAGMRVAWQVEIDPQARAVLRKHWPDVDLHEDVRDVGRHNLEPVDLICGGFPCQDLSVAGRRAGLAGERSGLFYEFMRVVAELAPRWVLVENVPGLLSSNGGRDMGAVLGTLAELGYGYAYRVLDLQHFGVPQRRRRVFIVGHLGGFCPPEILFESESVPGHSPPGREAGEGVAALPASGAGTARTGNERTEADLIIAATVTAKWANGTGGPAGDDVLHFVAHTLHGEGHDASEDGTGRGTPLVAVPHHASHPNGGGQVAVAFQERGRPDGRSLEYQPDVAYALTAPNDGGRGQERNILDTAAIPRRLTPRECERLMGWPDDWTRYGVTDDGREVEMADSPRYRMCGNGVGAPVAEWIGRRIIQADSYARKDKAA